MTLSELLEHPFAAAAWFHILGTTLTFFFSALAAIGWRARAVRRGRRPAGLPVTALKPIRGLDPALRGNLETFARLTAPEGLEVLLLLDDEGDEALPLCREIAAASPRFRVCVGTTPGLANPKVASLLFGLQQASHPLIWVTDSNVATSDAHLQATLEAWSHEQAAGRVPTLVYGPLTASGGTGLGAACERLHLSTFNNASIQTAKVVGLDVVVGKSLLFHRDDLRPVGGLEAFGMASGEDFAMGVAFRKVGRVACCTIAAEQPLGAVSLSDFFGRQARWATLRRRMDPLAFWMLEPFTHFAWLWLWAALGLVPWTVVGAIALLRALADRGLLASYAPHLGWREVLLGPGKEVVVLVSWFRACVSSSVTWRGRRLDVKADGTYAVVPSGLESTPTSEP
jgi:ceramide glucosyltransferase